MLSIEQSYSRIFRPWDVSENKKENLRRSFDNTTTVLESETRAKKKRIHESKRETRLRKIRGVFRKPEANSHQDATVSTTTEDADDKKPRLTTEESPVASLSQCCDRLLKTEAITKTTIDEKKKIFDTIHAPTTITPPIYNPHPMAFPPDYYHSDIAHALGVPPTDPLLLESLAQGYAMELEFARIVQQENEAKLLNSRKQRPKKYKCPHCQVGFSNNGQLKGHIRIHTGERPFKCDEKNCGKTFTRNEELTRHKRIHSGVRPYPCQTCGKKFGRRDHLKKHTRTHFLQAERMMPVFVPLSAVPHGIPYFYGY